MGIGHSRTSYKLIGKNYPFQLIDRCMWVNALCSLLQILYACAILRYKIFGISPENGHGGSGEINASKKKRQALHGARASSSPEHQRCGAQYTLHGDAGTASDA